MKPDEALGHRLSPRQSHGFGPLKKAVKVLGTRAVDRRTRIGKALDAWRRDLVADLGGASAISTQERALVEEAVLTKLILSSINVWLVEQPSLVNGRTRGALPVVLHRNGLVTTLRQLLVDLGLKRRSKPVDTLEAIAREYAATHEAEAADGGATPPREQSA